MEDVYKMCFYVGMIFTIIFLMITLSLFVILKIPKVIGDLTGRNAKKAIKEKIDKKGKIDTQSKLLREEQKKYYNFKNDKLKIRESKTSSKNKIDENKTDLVLTEKQTDILNSDNYEKKEDALGVDSRDLTTVLTMDTDIETTVLETNDLNNDGLGIKTLYNVLIVNTDENL